VLGVDTPKGCVSIGAMGVYLFMIKGERYILIIYSLSKKKNEAVRQLY